MAFSPNPARGPERAIRKTGANDSCPPGIGPASDTLRENETCGLPLRVDHSQPNAKHAPKASNRRVKLDPYAIAAVRLLILTALGFAKFWTLNGCSSTWSAASCSYRKARPARSRSTSAPPLNPCWRKSPGSPTTRNHRGRC